MPSASRVPSCRHNPAWGVVSVAAVAAASASSSSTPTQSFLSSLRSFVQSLDERQKEERNVAFVLFHIGKLWRLCCDCSAANSCDISLPPSRSLSSVQAQNLYICMTNIPRGRWKWNTKWMWGKPSAFDSGNHPSPLLSPLPSLPTCPPLHLVTVSHFFRMQPTNRPTLRPAAI